MARSLTENYPNTIRCGRCREVKPIKGSAGGGPHRHPRICADCRKPKEP